jgi:hypothetical protein
MQPLTSRGLILLAILGGLALSAATSLTVQRYPFTLGSDYGASQSFQFSVREAGCVLARIEDWESLGTNTTPAEELALALADANSSSYYARNDGGFSELLPLWVSYAISSAEVNTIKAWKVSVSNYTKGGSTATGTLIVEIPPNQMPCEFRGAIPRLKKGQIDLSWRYTGKPFKGSFMVERLTQGASQWQVVSACTQFPTSKDDFSCADTKVTSGIRYYYRACAAMLASIKCGLTNLTPPVSVRAP